MAGCSPKVDNRGYVKDATIKEQIQAGRETKEEVRQLLGSPSATSNYGQEAWYYVSTRKETVAFLAPEIVEQDVVRITFDANGVVSNIESYSKADGQDVDVSKRETPTEGHELGFIEQLLGNIGRFNKSEDKTPTSRQR